MQQIAFYQAKLAYETDSWDLSEALRSGENIVVVDTRAPETFKVEHIPSAINIPHGTISIETIRDLNKSTTYITYCDGIGCNASTKGALNLAKLGFNVKELVGGLDWWKRDGYPTEGKKKSPGTRVQCGC